MRQLRAREKELQEEKEDFERECNAKLAVYAAPRNKLTQRNRKDERRKEGEQQRARKDALRDRKH